MNKSKLDSLIRMANQIARNLTQGNNSEQAATAVASHLTRFWARPMKTQIIAYLNQDGSGLDPIAHRAVQQMADKISASH